MWLVYASLIFIVVVIILFIISALQTAGKIRVSISHLAETAEKTREQGETIKKEQDRLLEHVQHIKNDITNKKGAVMSVVNESKDLYAFMKYLKSTVSEKKHS